MDDIFEVKISLDARRSQVSHVLFTPLSLQDLERRLRRETDEHQHQLAALQDAHAAKLGALKRAHKQDVERLQQRHSEAPPEQVNSPVAKGVQNPFYFFQSRSFRGVEHAKLNYSDLIPFDLLVVEEKKKKEHCQRKVANVCRLAEDVCDV